MKCTEPLQWKGPRKLLTDLCSRGSVLRQLRDAPSTALFEALSWSASGSLPSTAGSELPSLPENTRQRIYRNHERTLMRDEEAILHYRAWGNTVRVAGCTAINCILFHWMDVLPV